MRMRGYLIKVLLTLIALAILYLPVAMSAQVCLSKKEARKLWPRQHLYWYSSDHCWSNRRGPPSRIRIDPILNSHAQVAELMPVAETKTDQTPVNPVDSWSTAKPIRIVEIIQSSIPVPITPVEVQSLEPLPTASPSLLLRLSAWLGGAFSALIFTLVLFYGRKVLIYVKRSHAWVHRRIGQARQKVSQIGFRSRDIESFVPALDIRYFLRRADRAGHRDNLAKILDCVENDRGDPCDEYKPEDHSALACWARSIRT